MNQAEQKKAAREFAARWRDAKGDEQSEARSFWIELCGDVLGVANPTRVLDFERTVRGRRIDVFYEDMGVLVEHKSRGTNLDAREQRGVHSDGSSRLVNAYEQAKWYADNLSRTQSPRWVLTCNFDEIRIYDLEKDAPDEAYVSIALDELPDRVHQLGFFTNMAHSRIEREKKASVAAGELVGKLYDLLSVRYTGACGEERERRSMNVLLVRLVFLLYAEDSGLLKTHSQFGDFVRGVPAVHLRDMLMVLFEALDTRAEERDPYLDEEIAAFPYIDGGLFADRDIVIPRLSEEFKLALAAEASEKFNWREVSPTIFGAIFESTLNPQTRRSGGMHYTSIENIHKVIDPLFLDDLTAELAAIEEEPSLKTRNVRLRRFKSKLASIKVIDPACGSGNFLTEAYLSLRKLENRVVEDMLGEDDIPVPVEEIVQVSIDQFYGIEVNDFAVAVAKTALWIAEEQAMDVTQDLTLLDMGLLPLKGSPNIACANALTTDWNDVLPASECSYLIGNPPFVGQMTREQADELFAVSGLKSLDYVAGWYFKASDYMCGTHARAAFVSTNSICQGTQVEPLWRRLFDEGIHIDFAWPSFVWDSEATDKAHVHVVVVGFSRKSGIEKKLYGADGALPAANINGYLQDAPDFFLGARHAPLCAAPAMVRGCQPTDGGNLVMTTEEKDALIAECPAAAKWIRRYSMGDEFINGRQRWCLWLVGATSADIGSMLSVQKRVEAVQAMRLASKKAATRKKAEVPWLFDEVREPKGARYIAVPQVSSERRVYVPIGFVDDGMIPGNMLFHVSDAGLYHFGVLTSLIHNAWMRAVCGRLEMRYRYSSVVVYNNFPWPGAHSSSDLETPVELLVDAAVREEVERCAQAVLGARAAHPGKSLAELYDPDKMPWDLKEAHLALDAAVEAAYGGDFAGDENKIVAHLFQRYAALVG